MKKKAYHHGNLKHALIESGIRLLNQQGMEAFSLRKVAARCGVSSSAPYACFNSREALLEAMHTHVNAKLLWRLYPLLRRASLSPGRESLLSLSLAYLTFFLEHPHYFAFLFRTGSGALPLSLPQALAGRRSPFLRLYQACCQCLARMDVPLPAQETRALSYLATLHGLLFFIHSPAFSYDKDWQAQLLPLLAPALDALFAAGGLSHPAGRR